MIWLLSYVAIGLTIALVCYLYEVETWGGVWEDYLLVVLCAALWLPVSIGVLLCGFLGWLLEHKDQWRSRP